MYEVPAPNTSSGSNLRAMCIARAGTSRDACARTLGRVASAITVIAENAAATAKVTPRLTSAMKPPTAGPINMPAMLVACM